MGTGKSKYKGVLEGFTILLCISCIVGLAACSSPSGNESKQTNDASINQSNSNEENSASKQVEGFTAATSEPLAATQGCLSCHDDEGFRMLPEDHQGRTDDLCLSCHQQNSNAGGGAPTPHSIGGTA